MERGREKGGEEGGGEGGGEGGFESKSRVKEGAGRADSGVEGSCGEQRFLFENNFSHFPLSDEEGGEGGGRADRPLGRGGAGKLNDNIDEDPKAEIFVC